MITSRLKCTALLAWVMVAALALPVLTSGVGGTAAAATRARVSLRLKAHFRIFDKQPKKIHAMPASSAPTIVERELPTLAGEYSNLGLDLSEVVGVPEGSVGEVWTVPGANGACELLVSSLAGSGGSVASYTCFSTATADAGRALAFTAVDGKTYTWGLVPNGNATVNVNAVDGTSTRVPVSNNVAFGGTSSPPSTVTLSNANKVTVTVGKPEVF